MQVFKEWHYVFIFCNQDETNACVNCTAALSEAKLQMFQIFFR